MLHVCHFLPSNGVLLVCLVASVSYEPRTLLTYAQNLEDAAWWCNENDAHLLVIQSVAELNQVLAQTSAVIE